MNSCITCTHSDKKYNEEPCHTCCNNAASTCAILRFLRACKWEPKNAAPNPVQTPETILQEAQRLVHGDRGADYGSPLDDFSRTAAMFNALKGTSLTAEDVALFMICVKLSREANRHKRDNMVDLCGYAQTLMMVKDERMRREELTLTFGAIPPDMIPSGMKDYSGKPFPEDTTA